MHSKQLLNTKNPNEQKGEQKGRTNLSLEFSFLFWAKRILNI